MTRRIGTAPSADEIEAMARRAMVGLPARFADRLGNVVLLVEELADDETLASLGIEDPFELTGLYEGVPLHEKSISDMASQPDRIRLFRRAILDEWGDGGEELEHLVAHVTIHEIGHHFGLSDEAMHALEDEA
jgi:predicted Zn-dependent protease with MMP-like domain